jgi:phage terminase Nu1 subunit (DNA packaging protein)
MDVTQKELSHILGISERRIRQLRDGGMFSLAPGQRRHNLAACVQEYITYKVDSESQFGAALDLDQARAEHEMVKIDISKLKLRKQRGELHEASVVEYVIRDMLIRFRNRLLSVPAKIAPLVIGRSDVNEVADVLKDEVLEALSELSEYDPAAFVDEGDDGDDEDDGEEDADVGADGV